MDKQKLEGLQKIPPEFLIQAYRSGYFPMSEHHDDDHVFWYDPDPRAVLFLEEFHVSRSLKKFLRKHPFRITCDQAFERVIRACAEIIGARDETWISQPIIEAYSELARRGSGHSVEVWEGEELVGGLYGVALGGIFFGESMFSRRENASKLALVFLVERLVGAGYRVMDTQFMNDHIRQFGVREIPREEYQQILSDALTLNVRDAFC